MPAGQLPEAAGRLPQGGAEAEHHPVARRPPAPQAQQSLLRRDHCLLPGHPARHAPLSHLFKVLLCHVRNGQLRVLGEDNNLLFHCCWLQGPLSTDSMRLFFIYLFLAEHRLTGGCWGLAVVLDCLVLVAGIQPWKCSWSLRIHGAIEVTCRMMLLQARVVCSSACSRAWRSPTLGRPAVPRSRSAGSACRYCHPTAITCRSL